MHRGDVFLGRPRSYSVFDANFLLERVASLKPVRTKEIENALSLMLDAALKDSNCQSRELGTPVLPQTLVRLNRSGLVDAISGRIGSNDSGQRSLTLGRDSRMVDVSCKDAVWNSLESWPIPSFASSFSLDMMLVKDIRPEHPVGPEAEALPGLFVTRITNENILSPRAAPILPRFLSRGDDHHIFSCLNDTVVLLRRRRHAELNSQQVHDRLFQTGKDTFRTMLYGTPLRNFPVSAVKSLLIDPSGACERYGENGRVPRTRWLQHEYCAELFAWTPVRPLPRRCGSIEINGFSSLLVDAARKRLRLSTIHPDRIALMSEATSGGVGCALQFHLRVECDEVPDPQWAEAETLILPRNANKGYGLLGIPSVSSQASLLDTVDVSAEQRKDRDELLSTLNPETSAEEQDPLNELMGCRVDLEVPDKKLSRSETRVQTNSRVRQQAFPKGPVLQERRRKRTPARIVPPQSSLTTKWALDAATEILELERALLVAPPPLSILPILAVVTNSYLEDANRDHRVLLVCIGDVTAVRETLAYFRHSVGQCVAFCGDEAIEAEPQYPFARVLVVSEPKHVLPQAREFSLVCVLSSASGTTECFSPSNSLFAAFSTHDKESIGAFDPCQVLAGSLPGLMPSYHEMRMMLHFLRWEWRVGRLAFVSESDRPDIEQALRFAAYQDVTLRVPSSDVAVVQEMLDLAQRFRTSVPDWAKNNFLDTYDKANNRRNPTSADMFVGKVLDKAAKYYVNYGAVLARKFLDDAICHCVEKNDTVVEDALQQARGFVLQSGAFRTTQHNSVPVDNIENNGQLLRPERIYRLIDKERKEMSTCAATFPESRMQTRFRALVVVGDVVGREYMQQYLRNESGEWTNDVTMKPRADCEASVVTDEGSLKALRSNTEFYSQFSHVFCIQDWADERERTLIPSPALRELIDANALRYIHMSTQAYPETIRKNCQEFVHCPSLPLVLQHQVAAGATHSRAPGPGKVLRSFFIRDVLGLFKPGCSGEDAVQGSQTHRESCVDVVASNPVAVERMLLSQMQKASQMGGENHVKSRDFRKKRLRDRGAEDCDRQVVHIHLRERPGISWFRTICAVCDCVSKNNALQKGADIVFKFGT